MIRFDCVRRKLSTMCMHTYHFPWKIVPMGAKRFRCAIKVNRIEGKDKQNKKIWEKKIMCVCTSVCLYILKKCKEMNVFSFS